MTVHRNLRKSPTRSAANRSPHRGILIAGFLQLLLLGCQSSGNAKVPAGSAMAPPPPRPRPIATMDHDRITIADIEPEMLEAIGGRIVQEYVLDVMLARAAARRSIVIEAEDLEQERSMLIANLADDPDRGERLLGELRRRQGLGPIRFEALLRRTALLRRLVAEDVEISEAARRGAHDLRHGPKRTTRIIAVEDLRTASDARARIVAGTPFATVAVESSLDASAARGGLLAPLSRLDPSWPSAFRRTVFESEVGGLSDPVQIDGRVLIVLVESERPATGVTFEAGQAVAEADARLAVERLLMDRLARRLAPEGGVKALDPSLRWSLSPIE